MKPFMRIAAPLAVLVPLSANAADYDPPIFVEEVPEYVPVEVGSGWYLRGDLGYTVNDTPYNFTFLGVETDDTPVSFSLGMGYQFTQYLRGELNAGLLSDHSYGATNGITTIELDDTVWSGMANVYADLGTFVGLTPYVGAGLGLVYAKSSADIDDPMVDLNTSDTQYEFAYSLGAGVAYRITQNLSVDVGYQFLSAPGLEYIDMDSLDVEKGVDYHQVKVGLRYELW
jgi:opacity protein-like surface antigen